MSLICAGSFLSEVTNFNPFCISLFTVSFFQEFKKWHKFRLYEWIKISYILNIENQVSYSNCLVEIVVLSLVGDGPCSDKCSSCSLLYISQNTLYTFSYYTVLFTLEIIFLLILAGKLVWSSLEMLLLSKYSNHGKYLTTFHVWNMNWQVSHHMHDCWIYYIEQLIEQGLAIHSSALTTLLVVTVQNQWVNISYLRRYDAFSFKSHALQTTVGYFQCRKLLKHSTSDKHNQHFYVILHCCIKIMWWGSRHQCTKFYNECPSLSLSSTPYRLFHFFFLLVCHEH